MATATEGKTSKPATKKQNPKPETAPPEVQSLESTAVHAYQQANATPRPPMDPEDVLALQRTVGNQAVQRLLIEERGLKQQDGSQNLAKIAGAASQLNAQSRGTTATIQRVITVEGAEQPERPADRPSGSAEEPAQAGPNLSIGLVDQNPDHMPSERDMGTFRGAAESWTSRSGGELFEVMEGGDIAQTLTSVLAAHPESSIGTLAMFGHGSSRSGWIGMGDVGAILLGEGIGDRLAQNLRVILYMCLAGADPGTTYETRNRQGETVEAPGETGEEEGGLDSYAALLSSRLAPQAAGVQVWAHTTRAHTTSNPNWRVFGGPPTGETASPGDPFFRHVFNDEFVDNLTSYLAQYRDHPERCPHGSLRRHMRRNREQVLEWLYMDFVRLTGGPTNGPERAMWAPMEPDAVAQQVRTSWLERYGLSVDELAPVGEEAGSEPEGASEGGPSVEGEAEQAQ